MNQQLVLKMAASGPPTGVLGLPFSEGGRGPGAFDCYGLYRHLLLLVGGHCPDYPRSGDPVADARLAVAVKDDGWDSLTEPEFSCAVLLRCAGHDCHVGFVLDERRFIHVYNGSGGVIVSRFDEPSFRRALIGFYRHRWNGKAK